MMDALGLAQCLPPKPTAPKILPTETRPSGITIRWTAGDQSPPVRHYNISWKAKSWWTSSSIQLPVKTDSEVQVFHITGVLPGENVRAWIYAEGETGKGPYADIWEFVRPDDLQAAVYDGNLDRIKELIQDKDASQVLSEVDIDGNTLAHWAAVRGNAEVLSFFDEKGVDIDVAVEPDALTPLHWLCIQSRIPTSRPSDESLLEAAKVLLKSGAQINAVSKKSRTALVLAVNSDLMGIVDLLMSEGANLETSDFVGDNVLHWAAYHGRVELVEKLHKKGLNLLQQDSLGQTPLHIAAVRAQVLCTKYLCEQGGLDLIEMRENKGKTAYDLASARWLEAIKQQIKKARKELEAELTDGEESKEMKEVVAGEAAVEGAEDGERDGESDRGDDKEQQPEASGEQDNSKPEENGST